MLIEHFQYLSKKKHFHPWLRNIALVLFGYLEIWQSVLFDHLVTWQPVSLGHLIIWQLVSPIWPSSNMATGCIGHPVMWHCVLYGCFVI